MPYSLPVAILQLRANAPFVLRIGYNDHKSVLDALQGRECEGARVPIEVLVVEGHWAGRHRDLVDEAAAGRQLVIDYRVDLWTLGDGASALPAGRSSAFSLEEIEKGAKGIVHEALAAQERTIWTLAPGCHIDDIGGAAWATTLRVARRNDRADGSCARRPTRGHACRAGNARECFDHCGGASRETRSPADAYRRAYRR